MYTDKHIKFFETKSASSLSDYASGVTFTLRYPAVWFADGILTKQELEIVRLNFIICNAYVIFNTARMMLDEQCSFREAYTFQMKEKLKYAA